MRANSDNRPFMCCDLPWVSRCLILGFWLALLVSGAAESNADVAEVLSAEDAVAGFRYNVSLFPRLHVTWRRVAGWADAWHGQNERQAVVLESEASSRPLSPEDRAELRDKALRLRKANSSNPGKLTVFADYWTDRTRFQVRMPGAPDPTSITEWEFPDDQLSSNTLLTAYKDQVVFSCFPGSSPEFRCWNGVRLDGERSGRIGDSKVNKRMLNFEFPPLGVADVEWGPVSCWNPVDRFFALPIEGMRVLGTENRGGRDVVGLEHLTLRPAPEGFAQAEGRFEIAEIIRAWVAPGEGFVPVRIEWRSAIYRDGKCLLDEGPPYQTLDVNGIATVGGAGYYPMQGRLCGFVSDPKWTGKPRTVDDLLNGRNDGSGIAPLVLHTEMSWQVDGVEANAEMSDSMFVFDFPENTNYYDETRSRVMITGLTEAEVDRLLTGSVTASAPNPRGKWFYVTVVTNIVVIIGVVLWLVLGRRRREGGKR